MLPKNVLYYGREDPLPRQVELRAGPLSLVYEEGDLRYVRLGEREVIRRIYVATRDRNWGTLPNVLSNVQMEVTAGAFRISYEVENKQGEIDFFWRGTITGDAQGTLTFAMDGEARSTFMRNRIGFCILHPASCAGAQAVVEHTDGSTEEGDWPIYLVPDQPVQPFADMQAIRHQVTPGVWAEVRFSGDVFEMEDQRNWTDASYKTFCTPLRLPYPVEVRAGTKVAQSVTLGSREQGAGSRGQGDKETRRQGDRGRKTGGRAEGREVTVGVNLAAPVPLPPLGLGVASHGGALSEREVARLRALRLHRLRVDLPLADADWAERLRRAAAEALALGVVLEVALLISENGEEELRQLRAVLPEVKPRVDVWLVYPAQELSGGGSPVSEAVALARHYLAGYDPAVRFAAGTNTDVIFMQRSQPPPPLVDLVCFAINPQVHAFDNASLMETLEAQGVAVTSARRLALGKPVMVSPVTLKPRFNPYATGAIPPTPPGQLPPQVDVRQMALFGAAWTAGSIKYLAENEASRLTYYETTGWRGVMETEAGSPVPDQFRSLPGGVFPLYHVLADVGEFAGGEVLHTWSSDALKVDGLALRQAGRMRIIVANTSPAPQHVKVKGLSGRVRVRLLDETSAEQAMGAPEEFRARPGQVQKARSRALELDLLPYAVARIDTE